MRESQRPSVAALSPAVRARTILAVEECLRWRAGGTSIRAPFIEEAGSPVLLLGHREAERLLAIGHAWAEAATAPELGRLRVGGTLWPVMPDAAGQRLLRQHAGCRDSCTAMRSHLVGVRVDLLALTDHRTGAYQRIDLDAYAAAAPDPMLTSSLRIRGHLNADHQEDLVALAARLLGVARTDLAAVLVDWIDSDGLELAVIDGSGSASRRFPFRVPLATLDDLGEQLHRLLVAS